MQVKFTVEGKPTAKGRPRFTKTGHAYTDAKTAAYEALVRSAYRQQAGQNLQGILHANIYAYFPIPKSTPKGLAQEMRDGKVWHTKKPDADNIAKSILDALNGVAYDDDSSVASLCVVKRYGDEPRVEVSIHERQTR